MYSSPILGRWGACLAACTFFKEFKSLLEMGNASEADLCLLFKWIVAM
jgi:hypothetical protein